MKEEKKTKKRLIGELMELRQRISELEKTEVERERVGKSLREELTVNAGLSRLYKLLISTSASIEDITISILEEAKRLTGSGQGYVSSIDPITGDNIGHTLSEMMRGQCKVVSEERRIIFPRGDNGLYYGLWGNSLNTLEPIFTNSPETHPASTGVPKGHIPLKNFLSVPVKLGGELVGQIALANKEEGYTDQDLKTIVRLAEVYALALQRMRAEESLRESQARYRAVVEDQTELICRFLPDGILTFVNEAYCRYFEKNREELIGKSFFTLIPEEDHEIVKSHFSSLSPERPVVTYEHKVFEPKGGILWQQWTDRAIFDERGRLTEYQSVGRDITERKQAEEALRQSEEFNRALVENSADRIFAKDIEGKYTLMNKASYDFWGIPDGTAIGKTDWHLHEESTAKTFIASDRVVFEAGKPYSVEERAIAKDGRDLVLSVVKSPIISKTGVITGLVGVSRDITDRKRLEERLAEINECFLNFAPDPLENINRLTELCGMLLGATCALYNRLDEGTLYSWGQWNTPPDYDPVDRPDGHICYDVIKKAGDKILVISNLPETPYAQTDPNVIPYGLQTYIGRAVKFGDVYVGSLCTVFQDDFFPSEDDKRLMEILASAIGVEEKRKQAEEDLKKAHDELERRVEERTAELVKINEQLKYEIEERKRAERALERQARQLEEANTALKVLMNHIKQESIQQEKNVIASMEKLIFPYLEKLEILLSNSDQKIYLDIIKENLANITSGFASRLSIPETRLTPMEIQVADLLRLGKTSKEIAELLSVSVTTISSHRSSIRKKLGLTSKKVNLKSYLQSEALHSPINMPTRKPSS